ncbi:MAG TPA: clostripain-related cysteine peptidase, partial [Pyrinomonadaceae bacterium]|nr:clostripain-related cysteine peptidase [Pyrinomonadaceae bacterium]
VDFLHWGITHYPADKYFVILSGHGNGVESNFLIKDSVPPQSLTIKQLRTVLEHDDVKKALDKVNHKKKIDIVGFDSCLMSMIEVGYELRDSVNLLVASQGSEANLGWPYKAMFEHLQADQTARPDDLARSVVDATVKYYVDFSIIANSSADISVSDLAEEKIKELVAAIDELAKALLDKFPAKPDESTIENDNLLRTVIFAHWYAQTYYNDQYTDIADFCDVLRRNLNPESFGGIIGACDRVIKAIENNFVIHNCYTGPMYQYSNGVSIYFPWAQIYPLYENATPSLDFIRHTHWLRFIRTYIKVTQRPGKPGNKPKEKVRIFRSKDNFPRTRGADDPSLRAKNPAQKWNVPACIWEYVKAQLSE